MNFPARGRAAGKVILLGEHAVVYGRPALAAGLGLGLEAVVHGEGRGPVRVESDRPELASDPRPEALAAAAAAALGLDGRGLVVRLRSDLPPGAGLGSSAALAIAVVRALAQASGRSLPRSEELAIGRRLEGIFHGQSSGIDPAAAALGTCFRFVRGDPPTITPLVPPGPLPVVILLGAAPRSTGAAVGALRTRWEAEPARYERLFDEIAEAVEAGVAAAGRGDLVALGRAMDRNQSLLETAGVSTPEVEARVAAARGVGALGAKLTGGGAGGAVVALAPDPSRLAAALGAHGLVTYVTHIGAAEVAAA